MLVTPKALTSDVPLAWLQQSVKDGSSVPMMEGATLPSLPKRLVEKIFSYNFPLNGLRAVACCQQLHKTLGEKLKASTHFARADWVILGELDEFDEPGLNGRVGQIIKLKPGDRTQYAVQVDGLSWRGPPAFLEEMKLLRIPGYEPPEIGSRPVSMKRFKLSRCKLHKVAAVRLYAGGEMQRSLTPSVTLTCKEIDKTFEVSAAQIPSELAIFSNPKGQSPIFEALGRPVVLRQVISAEPLFGDMMECHPCHMLRTPVNHVLGLGLTKLGPTIIAWQDQSDFTLDDMRQVWEFQQEARYLVPFLGELPSDTLVRLWQEAGLVNNIRTEEVVHLEAAAEISPAEARELVEAQLASTIQSEPMPSTMGECACVVTFHRTPASLDRAVSQSDSGRRLLRKGVNLKPCWANGAKILVEGLTEDIWKRACRDAGENPELRPAHVVLPSSALSEILAEVQKIPHSSRPRIKAGQATISVPDLSQFTDLSDTGARGSQESSYSFISASSSTVTSEISGWAAFIDGLQEKIMHIPLGPLNVTHGFIHEPEEAPITPRSVATESEPANSGINPRLFQ